MKVRCFYNCGASGLTERNIEDHYQKYHSKLKAYYGREFTCDNCESYYDKSSPLYSSAQGRRRLSVQPHYCYSCVKQFQSPTLTNLKPKPMNKRNLSTKKKTKTKLKPRKSLKPKKTLAKRKVLKKTALTLTKRTSTPSYYHCLLNQAKSGFKGRITKACKECKTKAPALNLAYKKEAQKLVSAYKQLGVSLSKILSH